MELTKPRPKTLPSRTNRQNDVVSDQSSIDLLEWDPFRRNNIRAISYLIILAVVVYIATVYTFSPSDETRMMNTMQLTLGHIRVHEGSLTLPTVDVALNATVEMRNMTMYSLNYTTLGVEVDYKGKGVGNGMSEEGGRMSEMGSSYVEATVELDRIEVDSNDVAKGVIPFNTIAQVDGFLAFMEHVPVMAKYSCEIDVDIKEQKITRQSCYPMVNFFTLFEHLYH
ncbi:hypothetical protein KSS87_017854 [Heliosperma pusillum]|nr:hypothetical protein KSS87_003359 [Heliosperma pusillum]KAH9620859.1 hypothetical protein KSS87_017854 [Heliosperma pusillum]